MYAIYVIVRVDTTYTYPGCFFCDLCMALLCRYDYPSDVGNFTENKLQIIANLTNFDYDPINYGFFRTLNMLDLFLDVLAEEKQDGNRTSDKT